jgi:hypothetical protein
MKFTRRLRASWLFALGIASSMTVPKVRPGFSDGDFEEVLRDSRMFAVCQGASAAARTAWREARVGTWYRQVVSSWTLLSRTERLRAAFASMVIGGIIALVLRALGPLPVAPLTWVLPVAAVLLGSIGWVAAGVVARAVAAETS